MSIPVSIKSVFVLLLTQLCTVCFAGGCALEKNLSLYEELQKIVEGDYVDGFLLISVETETSSVSKSNNVCFFYWGETEASNELNSLQSMLEKKGVSFARYISLTKEDGLELSLFALKISDLKNRDSAPMGYNSSGEMSSRIYWYESDLSRGDTMLFREISFFCGPFHRPEMREFIHSDDDLVSSLFLSKNVCYEGMRLKMLELVRNYRPDDKLLPLFFR